MHFGNPYFLWTLLVLAIPIIVHLVRLRKLKVIKFSSFKFLKQTAEQGARPKKLMRLLILAARCMALACIVLAFTLPSCNNTNVNPQKVLVGIYLDNSLSMAGTKQNPLELEKYKDMARQVVRGLPEFAEVKLISQSSFGGASNSLSPSQALAAIDGIEASNNSDKMADLLTRLTRSMETESGGQKRIVIISDFQQSGLGNLKKVALTDISYEAVTSLDNITENLSIDSAWIETPVALKGEPLDIHFIIKNHGKKLKENLPVKAYNKGVQLGLVSMTIPAGKTAEGIFNIPFSDDFEDLKLQIDDDGFGFDNTLCLNPGAAPSIAIDIVGQENPFLRTVINTQGLFKMVSSKPQAFAGDNCDYQTLKAKILPAVENGAQAFVSIVPSDDIAKLLGVNELKLKVGDFAFSPISLRNGFYQKVFTQSTNDINLPEVKKYYSTGGNSGYAEPILNLSNGDPYILKLKKGKGELYICLAPFNTEFSNWVKSSLFLPTVTQALLPIGSTGNLYGFINSTSPYLLHTTISNTNGEIVLKNGNAESVALISQGYAGTQLQMGDYAQNPGTYTLINKNTGQVVDRVALNIDRSESELLFANKSQIQDIFPDMEWTEITNKVSMADPKLAGGFKLAGMWRLFIWLAAAFFAIEMILIWLRNKNLTSTKA
jgi:hypothetical protein